MNVLNMARCGTSNIHFYEILWFIDGKYINLVIVYLNLVTFISIITIIITIKFHLCMTDKYASH